MVKPDNQNYIGCRKEPWKNALDVDHEVHEPPRAHPNYNGIGAPQASQPLHANPPQPGGGGGGGGPSAKFPIEALARREGVKLQEVVVPKDISIPTKNQTPIALKAGQRVMLIKTPKGIYLRYRDQIVKIRMPNGLLPFGSTSGSSSTGPSSGTSLLLSNAQKKSNPDVVTLHSSGEDD